MNCHDAQSVMHGYLDGELDPSVSLQYEQHVGECPACGKALAEQQAIQAEMKADSLYFQGAGRTFGPSARASLRKQQQRPCPYASPCAGLPRLPASSFASVLDFSWHNSLSPLLVMSG